MRRIILVLSVAALMAAIMVAMAAPAFAAGGKPGQGVPKGGQINENPGYYVNIQGDVKNNPFDRHGNAYGDNNN